jgi:uncharacterized Zn finger protein
VAIGLGDLIDRNALRQLAGSRYYRRGEGYFEDGAIESLRVVDETITGKVRGTHLYRTELSVDEGEIVFACSCPLGMDGEFCKHLVATGLAWLSRGASSDDRFETKSREDLRRFLSKKKKVELVEMIVEQTDRDDALRERLLMRVAASGAAGAGLDTFKATIDDAISVEHFVHYDGMWDYSERLEQVAESLRNLVEAGSATAAIELAEHALACAESSIEHVDDSAGIMGQFLGELEEIHLTACRIAKPDPIVLARRLLAWQLRCEWDTFSSAAIDYADVLGESGLRAYRELAEAEWATVPLLEPGEDDHDRYRKRYPITRIMRNLAELSGDPDELIEVESRDLSDPWRFLEIAKRCAEAGRHDDALEWAERGVRSFKGDTDRRLLEFLAGEYQRRERHDEAMEIVWSLFTRQPSMDTYSVLRDHAKRAKAWPEWRDRALKHIRKTIADRKRAQRGKRNDRWSAAADHSLLVEIFLNERKYEDAWNEAESGGCQERHWLALARHREKSHPLEAAAAYQRLVEPIINRKDNHAYKEAAQLVVKIRSLMNAAEKGDEFEAYLDELRGAHKRKRNFMAALDRAGLRP